MVSARWPSTLGHIPNLTFAICINTQPQGLYSLYRPTDREWWGYGNKWQCCQGMTKCLTTTSWGRQEGQCQGHQVTSEWQYKLVRCKSLSQGLSKVVRVTCVLFPVVSVPRLIIVIIVFIIGVAMAVFTPAKTNIQWHQPRLPITNQTINPSTLSWNCTAPPTTHQLRCTTNFKKLT